MRILDFPHAAQRLADVPQAIWGDSAAAHGWAAAQRRALHEGAAPAVLAAIRALPVTESCDPAAAAEVQTETLGCLAPRQDQMRYAAFRAAGLPIGSGMAESGNKLVVDGRLGGAGCRWAEANVTPLVALRSAICSDRWDEAWRAIARARRQRPSAVPASSPVASAATVAAPHRRSVVAPALGDLPRGGPKTIVNGRPTAAHPWKRGLRHQPPCTAKL